MESEWAPPPFPCSAQQVGVYVLVIVIPHLPFVGQLSCPCWVCCCPLMRKNKIAFFFC